MATCSNILAWKIPWTEEPGGLQSTWLQRVGHKCVHTCDDGSYNLLPCVWLSNPLIVICMKQAVVGLSKS